EGTRGGVVGDVDVRPAVVVEIGCEHAQAVRTARTENAGGLGNVGEGAVPVVMVEDILASLQTGRPAGDHHALVEAWTRLRNWSRGQIHVDVIGDEEIEFAVAVV